MATYMIGYDLNKPGQNYTNLIETIKKLGTSWWHCLDSTWIVISDKSAIAIRDALTPHMDRNDEVLVAILSSPAAWSGFDQQCSDWLKNNL